MLYKEYDDVTLRRLQRIELEILNDFDELCAENGLTYIGCGVLTMKSSCASRSRKNTAKNTMSSIPPQERTIPL